MPAETEVDMLFKSKAPEKDKNAAGNTAEVMRSAVQPQRSVVEHAAARPPMTKAGTTSCIGSSMSIAGNIECKGPAQVFGRIEGALHASDLLIGVGAQVEGSVLAQDVTVCGRVKGTIRAVGVKLQNGGAVEGDIFHRSLSIDENSLLKDRRGGLRIQQIRRRASTRKGHRKKTYRTPPRPRYPPSTPICSASTDGLRSPILK
jgi:cytoskeletal protein CcmA (bactofilin family)